MCKSNNTLDTVKALRSTKSATLERYVLLDKCIKGEPAINVVEHYGDVQDIYSEDNTIILGLSDKAETTTLTCRKRLK